MNDNFTFEDKIDELDDLLKKNKGKWHLNSVSWIDYDDICQIIRSHIYKKWDLWDQSRPFRPWANTIISNQIKNQIRNNYTNFAKPCVRCPHNMGDSGEHCYFTPSGKQCSECPLYKKWEQKKKQAFDVKLPVSLCDATPKNKVLIGDSFCYERASTRLHKAIIKRLKTFKHKKIYYMLYVEHMTEEEVAKEMGFKAETSKRKNARYKHIKNLQKRFKSIAKEVLKTEDLFY